MTKATDLAQALYRNNLPAYIDRAFAELNPGTPYIDGHHIRAICHKLEQVLRGEVRRLIIAMPPAT